MEILNEIYELNQELDRTPFDIFKFETRLVDLWAGFSDTAAVPLFKLFRDDSKYDEAMFAIIHTVEVLSDDEYVEQLMKCFSELSAKSPRWASIIVMRILNSPSTLEAAIRNISQLPAIEKDSWSDILIKINDVSSDFKIKTMPLLSAIS